MRRLFAAAFLVALASSARAGEPEPAIDHIAIPPAAPGDPVVFFARVTNGRFVPRLHFRDAGVGEYLTAMMERRGEDFAAAVIASGDLEYWLEAVELGGDRRVQAGSQELPLVLKLPPGTGDRARVVDVPAPWPIPLWVAPVAGVAAVAMAAVLLFWPHCYCTPDLETSISVNPP